MKCPLEIGQIHQCFINLSYAFIAQQFCYDKPNIGRVIIMLELKTLFVTSFCIVMVMCLLNFLTWRANKNTPGTLPLVFYPIFILLALALFKFHNHEHGYENYALSLGYLLLFSASVIQAVALCRFFKFQHISLTLFLIATTWLSVTFNWFLFGDNNLHARILIYDLQRIIEGVFLSYLFIRVALKRYPNASIIYLIHCCLLMGVFSLRTFLLKDLSGEEIIKDGWFSAAVLFIGILTPMFYATGLAVLCNERRSENLKSLTEKAQKDAELRGLFLSTMSHEIRTPLNGILGSAQLIMNQLSDPKGKPYCEAIIHSAESLNFLVTQVLNYATVDQSTSALYEEDVELEPWLKNICLLSSPIAEQKRLKFELNVNLPDKSCYYFDQERLRQVLSNLINNAIKFTDQGSVKIQVDLLHSKTLEHTLRFSVQDSGPGIEDDDIEYLTEPYVQTSSGKKKGGTGLGLAISSRILAKLGSVLEIESEIGKGSTFSFNLTIGLGELSLVEQRHKSKQYLTGLNILLVEDLPLNQKIAIELMAMDEHKVKLADTGKNAIELLQQHKFDVILLDMNLPDISGQTVLRELQTISHLNSSTPILAFTASLSKSETDEYESLGIKDVVAKPIKQEKLRQAITNSQKGYLPISTVELKPLLYDVVAAHSLATSFNEDELSSVYNEFVLSARSKLNRCQEIEATDQDQCIKILHRQASTALQLGFNLYGLELKKLERRLLDKKTPLEFTEAIEIWQQSLAQYLKHVRSML
ncbi:putative control sensor/kinase protein (ArcB, TorS, ChiS, LuxQ, BvgS family) [Pseudoalteromonas tunicata D2]|uniref:histidine kinase n=2 Tax=Pseudoalteromonas tunicata TaxID=314281 RepID=A4CE66_9GAMM|nr:putative control sensor/kinase protein (ArcB, TorS, ChiS, LuxQ, BvgS family) [Pseudoalteromonas tunicata D2]